MSSMLMAPQDNIRYRSRKETANLPPYLKQTTIPRPANFYQTSGKTGKKKG